MKTTLKLAGAALAAALIGGAQPAVASSHREAPLISDDPSADSTDFYMFRSPTTDAAATNTVTFVANYWPMQEPGGGPNWVRFGDSVLYEIKIDNDGDAKEDITYQFRFTTTFKKGTTSFLFAGGPVNALTDTTLNVVQNYTVTRIDKNGTNVVVQAGVVPPPYTGDFTMPTYNALATAAISTIGTGGGKVFAGQRDDPFFADLGAIFDLVRIRCNNGGGGPNLAAGCAGTANVKGVDFLAGYNVHSIVLQVPIAMLTADGTVPTVSAKGSILGAWTTASRQRTSIRRAPTATAALGGVKVSDSYGQWVQVSRLGLPLINEVIVPVGLKDYYNTTAPTNDGPLFTGPVGGPLLSNPELSQALKALYGINIPAPGRDDITDIVQYHIALSSGGAPVGPFKGKTYQLAAADILRVDLAVAAPADQTTNRLGAVGVVGGAMDNNVGFPNGRRLHDDVVDILERVVGGGILRGFSATAPNNALGDAIDANDAAFLTTFPYVAAPWSGSKVAVPAAGITPAANTNLLHQVR